MLSPRVALVIAIVSVSSSSILIRLSAAPPLIIASYRLGIASLIMIAAAYTTKELHQLAAMTKKEIITLFLSGFFLYIHFYAWITSLFYTTVATSVIIVDSSPIFVVILSYITLKERFTSRSLAGIFLSIAGAVLIGVDSPVKENITGIALAFLGALGLAGYLVMGRNLRKKLDTFSYVSGAYSISFLLFFVTSLLLHQPFTGYTVPQYVIFILLALFPSCLGHTLYNYCLRYLKAATVSVAILGEPVGATLLAILVFTEIPTLLILTGGVLVMAGIYIVVTEYES